MKLQAFEKAGEQNWEHLEHAIELLEKRKGAPAAAELPRVFRQVCGDLALAQYRMYGRRLTERLNTLVIRSYGVFQKAVNRTGADAWRFFAATFPQAVRREWRLFWFNFALFWVPMFAFILAAHYEPKWIFALVGPETQAMFDKMYSSDTPTEALRAHFGSDFMMWAHYIQNNVSIGFRIFAGGVLATLGAIFFVAFNGIYCGAVAGYIHYAGHTTNFYRFVVGHSSLELTGFIICGVAGMRLGLALLKPGRLRRSDALREAGQKALPCLYGGSAMIFLAAFVEGFWSASEVSPVAKYVVGLGLWAFMTLYFLFAGRSSDAA